MWVMQAPNLGFQEHRFERLAGNPIIRPGMDERMGSNINGPSLISVPTWIEAPLGKYYLYFAHHAGSYIRLAYADRLDGRWSVYSPGTLQLSQSYFMHHIASPDVHVDQDRQVVLMYYHGLVHSAGWYQATRLAISVDGIHFTADRGLLGPAYMRVFRFRDAFYAIAKPGLLLRSADWSQPFLAGPQVFAPIRHAAVLVDGTFVTVFFTRVGDCPEVIYRGRLVTDGPWTSWRGSDMSIALRPEMPWEGGLLPLARSRAGGVDTPKRELRDPYLYVDRKRQFLIYATSGESGLAIAASET